MPKIHTRMKRKIGLSSTRKHQYYFHPAIKKNRPRTFKTEESANKWAAAHGLKPAEYSLNSVKKGKRFQVASYEDKNKNIANKRINLWINEAIFQMRLPIVVKNSALKCGACSGVFEHARKSLAFLELKQQGVHNSDFRHINIKFHNSKRTYLLYNNF